jgi:alkyl hydroperoxide reductase subunit AhpC
MTLYNEMLKEFQDLGAELIGISVDGAWCHAAFARDRKLHFPLLADFEPKGAVARDYGVYRDKDGVSERALFVINANGTIHWSYVSPLGVNLGANGILSALEDLQNKTRQIGAERGGLDSFGLRSGQAVERSALGYSILCRARAGPENVRVDRPAI